MSKQRVSRRRFLQTSSGAALGVGLASGCVGAGRGRPTVAKAAPAAFGPGKATPNEKIVVGFIGVAGRGRHHLSWFGAQDDVEIGAVCDVYRSHLDAAVEQTGGKAKAYSDFRKLLEQRDLDAVVIATPPHWHALITVYACQAGKDVYCEKPMCLLPAEGRAMVKAARENHCVTQVGTQVHSMENYIRTVETVRSGVLGKLTAVRTLLSLNEAPDGIGHPPDSAPPDGLDWDMWLGPAPKVPFNPGRFEHGRHRYFEEYVGSWLHEMGPHIIDLPVWALKAGFPKTVYAAGGKFAINDISTIPDTLEVIFEYDGFVMTWSNMCANSNGHEFQGDPGIKRRLGITFHGVNGTLTADYGTHELIGEGDRLKDIELPEPYLPRPSSHGREFLDCIRTRALPSCDVEKHYPLHVALNLGNLSYKLGRKLEWDAERDEIVNDREANALAQPHYRRPWTLPV